MSGDGTAASESESILFVELPRLYFYIIDLLRLVHLKTKKHDRLVKKTKNISKNIYAANKYRIYVKCIQLVFCCIADYRPIS